MTSNKLSITSSEFNHEGNIPSKYTCDGENINPSLYFSNIPKDTESLVLIVDDPDVPKHLREDGIWDHWLVFNIPANTVSIFENTEPLGMHGKGTAGNFDYHGPCPPDGEHRYFFKLYALDIMLDLKEGANKREIEKAMEDHIIEKAELIAKYKRK